MPSVERLQKVLARAGVASRRHAEELISAGRVRVNGRIVTELGSRVDPGKDKVEVDGRRVLAEPRVYYMFHKPRGCVTTLDDPEGRATIRDYLKELPARVFPVGRLDFHTSGALLLMNDGDLAQALLHPKRTVAKTYVAKLRGVPTDLQLDRWRAGMELEPVEGEYPPVITQPADIEVLRHAPSGLGAMNESGTTWVKVTLREGRNRQIHRMAEATSLFVMRLARIAFAGINTDGLRPGELRALSEKEITALRASFLRAAENEARSGARTGRGDETLQERPEPARWKPRDLKPGAVGRAIAPARDRGPAARRGEGPSRGAGTARDMRGTATRRDDGPPRDARGAGPKRDDGAAGGSKRGPGADTRSATARRDDGPPRDSKRGPGADVRSAGPRGNAGGARDFTRGPGGERGTAPRQDDRAPRGFKGGPGASRDATRGPRRDDGPPRDATRGPRRDDGPPRDATRGPRRDDGPPRDATRGPGAGRETRGTGAKRDERATPSAPRAAGTRRGEAQGSGRGAVDPRDAKRGAAPVADRGARRGGDGPRRGAAPPAGRPRRR